MADEETSFAETVGVVIEFRLAVRRQHCWNEAIPEVLVPTVKTVTTKQWTVHSKGASHAVMSRLHHIIELHTTSIAGGTRRLRSTIGREVGGKGSRVHPGLVTRYDGCWHGAVVAIAA